MPLLLLLVPLWGWRVRPVAPRMMTQRPREGRQQQQILVLQRHPQHFPLPLLKENRHAVAAVASSFDLFVFVVVVFGGLVLGRVVVSFCSCW